MELNQAQRLVYDDAIMTQFMSDHDIPDDARLQFLAKGSHGTLTTYLYSSFNQFHPNCVGGGYFDANGRVGVPRLRPSTYYRAISTSHSTDGLSGVAEPSSTSTTIKNRRCCYFVAVWAHLPTYHPPPCRAAWWGAVKLARELAQREEKETCSSTTSGSSSLELSSSELTAAIAASMGEQEEEPAISGTNLATAVLILVVSSDEEAPAEPKMPPKCMPLPSALSKKKQKASIPSPPPALPPAPVASNLHLNVCF
ncbi:hypothetical protein Acr_00g0075920 [Actinidia rufa]|uniref:Uncharacterized protein n=1 Tax=Actinidia rufa TaxID=165716 RepID=A0A7J0DU48_9ERIC|nr:hypothetical protein Acr_00g0075920 [Actinidia rufa]